MTANASDVRTIDLADTGLTKALFAPSVGNLRIEARQLRLQGLISVTSMLTSRQRETATGGVLAAAS